MREAVRGRRRLGEIPPTRTTEAHRQSQVKLVDWPGSIDLMPLDTS
jgi:hypothetical protein